ncbi:MAG: hypothetical protein J6C23_07050 [Clostridia bacterium]|nr:hypothetical protein [Clostridia bacterium]
MKIKKLIIALALTLAFVLLPFVVPTTIAKAEEKSSQYIITVQTDNDGFVQNGFVTVEDDNVMLINHVGAFDKDSTLTYEFAGDILDIYGFVGADCGEINVKIDGEDKGNFSLTSAQDTYKAQICSLKGLGNKKHTLVITVVSEDKWVALDYIKVDVGAKAIQTINLAQGGKVITSVLHPTGGGAKDLNVIKSGILQPTGNVGGYNSLGVNVYDSYTGAGPNNFWMGYEFADEMTFEKLVFQEGGIFGDGGYFAEVPVIQVRQNGQWNEVVLTNNPGYVPNDTKIPTEIFTFKFEEVSGDAIRIYGKSGGSANFVSVSQIEVYSDADAKTLSDGAKYTDAITYLDHAEGYGHIYANIIDEKYLVSEGDCDSYPVYKQSCVECGEAHADATFEDKSGELGHELIEKVADEYFYSGATCKSPAKYYKSCSICGAKGGELFEHGEPIEHNFQEIVKTENRVSSATCTEQAVYYKSCADCGAVSETEMFKFGAVAGHNYQNVVDDKYLVSGATCTAPAIYKASCTKCGEAHEEDTFTSGSILKHSYVYKETVAPNWSEKKNGYEIWECENDPTHTEQRNVVYWYSLSAYVSVENGTVNGEESATVEKGTSVTVIAGTYEGKVFKHWTVNGETVSENAEYTFVADGNIEVVAVFEKEPQKPASTGGCGARAMDVLALIAGLCAVMFVFKKH